VIRGTTITLEIPKNSTVRDLLDQVFIEYGEEAKKEIMDETGKNLAPYYKVLIDSRNFNLLNDFNTQIQEKLFAICDPKSTIAGN
jgi:uncharacterized phage-associated protein